VEIRLFRASEEFCTDVKVGIHRSGRVKESNADMQWGRMAVVNPEAIEYDGKILNILSHEIPEPRIIARA
jgi:hypothetical protein